MKRPSQIVFVLLFALGANLIAPATPTYALSINDLLPATGQNTSSSGNILTNLLLGLLFGKLLGNMQEINLGKTSPGNTVVKGDTAAIMHTAQKYMDVPYVWGGQTPSGFDCSGFTQYVMKQNGITIPRTAAEQFAAGTAVNKSGLQVGDLVFFSTYKAGASHVGFYMGDGKFIHASSAAEKVSISALDEAYYTQRYLGARRYTP